jgi:hypothetical protein
VTRAFPCRRAGCCGAAASDGAYCSRRCTTIETRRLQGRERRSEIGRSARRAQRDDERERLLARVKLFARTEDERILLAYSLGKNADKTNRYRARRMRRYQQAMASRVA